MGINIEGPVIYWLIWVFFFGAIVGSFINACVARLPLEKSCFWPGSRCMTCLQPIGVIDKIPILGYFIVAGKCRKCKAPFSIRYPVVELFTALAFVGLFFALVIENWFGSPFLAHRNQFIRRGHIPWQSLIIFAHAAALTGFLITVSLCDMDGRIIPLSITILGTMVGLLFATFCAWPWPLSPEAAAPVQGNQPWWNFRLLGKIPLGQFPWPFWGPLPEGLPSGSWQLGLVNGLTGALAGTIMMRVVKFVFERGLGKEALGLGDADLMMMAGSFLGWQIIVVAFFVGAVAALVLTVPLAIWKGENALAFGPGLALGIMITWLSWPWMGERLQPFLYEWITLVSVGLIMAVGMFLLSMLFRRPAPEA
jgi:leader peptidase (prepilin peptidase)/N-methyltransferase